MGERLEDSFANPPKLRQGYLLLLVFILMIGILLVGWLPEVLYFNLQTEAYLTMHMIVMIFSIVVSLVVFVAGWYDFRITGSVRELALCLTFLMVGLIDIAHTLSYEGMHHFITANSLNKSTTYYVVSRLVESIGLLIVVLIRPVRKKFINPYLAVITTVIITVGIIVAVAYETGFIPDMFVPGTGQTTAKVILDYVIIVIKGFALYHLIRLNRNYSADYYLQAALIFGIFSEAAFTLYSSAFDTYNFLGHIYKLMEFLCIMNALFVLSVVRLYQTNTILQNQKKRMAEINVKLETANKLKNEFLTNTNHELRTPLTAIIAFTELLLDKDTGPLNPVQKDYVNEINESSQQLLNYINNLLDLSKIEAGKMELHRELIDIKDIFNSILRKNKPIFKLKNQSVSQSIGDKVPLIYVDPPKIMQIIINLLMNAHKFTPDGGSLELTAELKDSTNEVVVCVTDNGIGISPSNQELIFEKFKQANSITASLHPGTGLGLTLVKYLVELHGGRVSLDSKPGKGSRFCFTIPLKEGQEVYCEESKDFNC